MSSLSCFICAGFLLVLVLCGTCPLQLVSGFLLVCALGFLVSLAVVLLAILDSKFMFAAYAASCTVF